jgi:hypothetical protein
VTPAEARLTLGAACALAAILGAGGLAKAQAQTTANQPPPASTQPAAPPPAPTAPTPAPATPPQPPADPNAVKALVSQPMLPALRDGTLGIPSNGAGGVSALINNRIVANTGTYQADFFAQVGRLNLSDRWDFDILGETFSASVPTVGITPPSSVRPLATLKQMVFESIGFRLNGRPIAKTADTRATRLCLNYLRAVGAKALTPAQKAQCVAAKIATDPELYPSGITDDKMRDLVTQAQERAMEGESGMLGGRFLYSGSGSNPIGLAGEAAYQYVTKKWSVFASGAWLYLMKTDDSTGATILESEKVNEAKLGLGGSWTFSGAPGGTSDDVRPRLGIYFSGSRNWWTNPYAAPGTEADIRGYQIEGSLYASGHFTGGFSGLFAFSVIRPYGHESDLQYVISVAPSLGTALP